MRTWVLTLTLTSALLAESVAGLKWTAPHGWKSEGPRQMRAATYSVPLASGDQGTAECAVYFFGMGGGGSIQANIDRWQRPVPAKRPAGRIRRSINAPSTDSP